MNRSTEEILQDLMSQLRDRQGIPATRVSKKLLVLSTPRSGSSLFCDVLSRTGLAGDCKEWFNLRYIQAYASVMNESQVDFNGYLRFVMEKTQTENGVFSVNVHVEDYVYMVKQQFDPLAIGFDVLVQVSRLNKLKQAVSLARAWRTDQWTADSRSGIAAEKVDLPPALVASALHHITSSEQTYADNLKQFVQAEFLYEDFLNLDRPEAFVKTLELLGISEAADFSTTMTVQAGEDSRLAEQNFLNYITAKPTAPQVL